MKGEVTDKWGDRVRIAEAGLEELASQSLNKLRNQLEEIADTEGSFNPRNVVANPATLRQSVRQFQKYLRVMERTPIYFRIMLALGPILTICCILLVAFGAIILTSWSGVQVTGYEEAQAIAYKYCVIGFLAVLGVSTIAFLIYVISVSLVSSAEVLSKKLQNG